MPRRSLTVAIECLRCGTIRRVKGLDRAGDCNACGGLGWELPARIAELQRLALGHLAPSPSPAPTFSAARLFRGGGR